MANIVMLLSIDDFDKPPKQELDQGKNPNEIGLLNYLNIKLYDCFLFARVVYFQHKNKIWILKSRFGTYRELNEKEKLSLLTKLFVE